MKILSKILSLVILAFLCSCLEDSEYDYSSDAAVLSFSIGNFEVVYNDVNSIGEDTVVSRIETGSNYKFTIDQKRLLIYNPDSLPFGSVVSNILTSTTSDGVTYYRKKNSDNSYVDTLWTSSDSIDFREPVRFFVQSTDGKFIREYTVSLNVFQQDPDSMSWKKIIAGEIPALVEQKAIIKNDTLIVVGKDFTGTLGSIRRPVGESGSWNTFSALNGIGLTASIPSLTLFKDTLFMVDNGKLFWSCSGVDWIDAGISDTITRLIPFGGSQYSDGYLWGINNSGRIIRSSTSGVWEDFGALPEKFPNLFLNGICYPLRSNSGIIRNIIIGIDTTSTRSYASVWSKLSTDNFWTEVSPSRDNTLRCPRLENLSAIYYDNELFAFGGASQENYGSLPAFYGFFQSSDHGITWRDCEQDFDEYSTWNRFMELPDQLKGVEAGFSFAVDSRNRIWIIPGKGGEVWIGAINRLLR